MSAPDRAPRGLRWTGPGATFVLVLLCLVLAATLAAGLWWRQQQVVTGPTARTPVTSVEARDIGGQVAGPLTERVLSYSWRDYDRRVADVRELLTPRFAQQYDDQMAGLRDEVVPGKVVVRATATDVAVVSASRERVVALVFLDQSSSAEGSAGRRNDQLRVLVTVTPDEREWRVARIDAF